MPKGSGCPSPASVYLGFVNEVASLCLVWQTWSEPPSWRDGLHTTYRAQRGRNDIKMGALISESLDLDSIFCFRDSDLCCLIEKSGSQHSWRALSAPEPRSQQWVISQTEWHKRKSVPTLSTSNPGHTVPRLPCASTSISVAVQSALSARW